MEQVGGADVDGGPFRRGHALQHRGRAQRMAHAAVPQYARLGQYSDDLLGGFVPHSEKTADQGRLRTLVQYRGRGGHVQQLGVPPVQAGQHGVGISVTDDGRGPVLDPGIRRIVVEQRVDQQRITVCQIVVFLGHGSGRRLSPFLGEQIGDVRHGQRRQPDALVRLAGQFRVEKRQRRPASVPLAQDEQHSGRIHPSLQRQQQPQRGGIGELQIVDHDHEGALPGQAQQHSAELTHPARSSIRLRRRVRPSPVLVPRIDRTDEPGGPFGQRVHQVGTTEQLIDHSERHRLLRP
nr:hypothetical protein [Micromonospora sp. 4G55]